MKNSKTIAARLASTKGRIVGITTKSRKFNGQIRSVTPSYVTMYDRNAQKQFKFALSSVVSVTGV